MDSKIVLIELSDNSLILAEKQDDELFFFGEDWPGIIVDKNHYQQYINSGLEEFKIIGELPDLKMFKAIFEAADLIINKKD